MQSQDHLRQFIRETLGCSCPDEVLEAIECTPAAAGYPLQKLNVGGRLLVYIIDAGEAADLPAAVRAALERGVAERDTGGFNRFRLVLSAAHPEQVRGPAEQAFAESSWHDEKTHLHVLAAQGVAGLCH